MVALKKHQLPPSSRTDSDWRAAKAHKAFAGFIFICSTSSMPDPNRRIFGLPAHHEESVRCIRKGMPLFLYNYTTRLLHGIFEAASDGGFNIDPYAGGIDATGHGRHPNVSRYPAQVRVRIRDERPPLEEEAYRRILNYVDGHKFSLELTVRQVQQLLHLFGLTVQYKHEHVVEKMGNRVIPALRMQDPESPRFVFRSDSDCRRECSSRGALTAEDEWTDNNFKGNILAKDPILMHGQLGDNESMLCERLSHTVLVDNCENGSPRTELNGDVPYDYVSSPGLRIVTKGRSTVGSGNGYEFTCKGTLPNAAHWPRSEAAQSVDDNDIALRLHDSDPAVNSNSITWVQADVNNSLTPSRLDDVTVSSLQVQSQFANGENVIFIPVQRLQHQQREMSSSRTQPQKANWNDARKLSKAWSTPNFRKHASSQERSNKPRDIRYHKQQSTTEDHQSTHVEPQQIQINQVLVPICTQNAGLLQEQGHMKAILSPIFMSPNSEGIALALPQTNIRLEDSEEGYGLESNDHLLPNGLQQLLQSGRFPILLMPSIIPRFHASPPALTAGFIQGLHYDILEFARLTRPSAEIQRYAEAAIDCVRGGVKMVWPEADIEVFGSFATGLCLQHSDVDLAVIDAPRVSSSENLSVPQSSAILIRELASSLRAYEWCESINPLDTASVPVLKCRCQPFALNDTAVSMPSIAIDITIGSMRNPSTRLTDAKDQIQRSSNFITRHTGGAAREYVLNKIQELPALAPLVLLLKSYLHHKHLSNVYLGGLGSFSLTLLLAFYLERVPIPREVFRDGILTDLPISPTSSSPLSCSSEFTDDSDISNSRSSCGVSSSNSTCDMDSESLGEHYVRRAANVIDRVLLMWSLGGSPYLGTLLLGFLQTFGVQLDLSCEKIILKGLDGEPGGLFKRDDRHVALWIDDPLRPGVNVGAGSFAMVRVQTAFKEMLQVLLKQQVVDPPLCCNDIECQDLLAMTHLSHLRQLLVGVDGY